MKIRFLIILSLILIASAETAFACVKTETGTPVCAFWTRADVVFTGKVLKVEGSSRNEDSGESARKVRFQVLENFKGADNQTFNVVVKTDCGLNIKSGQTWIIYAASDIVLKSFSAVRGVKIEPKTKSDEAAALKDIFAGKTPTAISGRFVSAAQNAYLYEPVEIAVAGNGKSFAAKTDTNGAFNLAVPDGNYRVELKFPYRASFKWDEYLLGTSLTEGVPTFFKYDVRLNDGDCNFNFFEVLKK